MKLSIIIYLNLINLKKVNIHWIWNLDTVLQSSLLPWLKLQLDKKKI